MNEARSKFRIRGQPTVEEGTVHQTARIESFLEVKKLLLNITGVFACHWRGNRCTSVSKKDSSSKSRVECEQHLTPVDVYKCRPSHSHLAFYRERRQMRATSSFRNFLSLWCDTTTGITTCIRFGENAQVEGDKLSGCTSGLVVVSAASCTHFSPLSLALWLG